MIRFRQAPTLLLIFVWTLISISGIIFQSSAQAEEEKVFYDAKGKRDPFVPIVREGSAIVGDLTNAQTPDDFTVDGVVVGNDNKSALIISGQVFEVGQSVGQVKIDEIYEDRVIFSVGDEKYTKLFYEEDENLAGSIQ